MIYTKLTKKAMKIAFEAHKEQKDKSGLPYIYHPIHLAEQMEDEATTCVAILHDVVEDTEITFEDLIKEGFTDEIISALKLMTHDDSVPYMDYVAMLKDNRIARTVKLADLRHNSDPTRLDVIDEKAQKRNEKYQKAIKLLMDLPESNELKTKIIYFVHGTTYDNAAEKCSGWKQVELNDLGKEQAENLGNVTKDIKFDVIFTSDLIRAVDSSNIAWPTYEKIQDERLRECNYGDYDGESKNLVVYEEHINEPFPNGESLKDVEKRMAEFIEFLKKEYVGKTIGIVAHRAPQLALEVLTKNMTWDEALENDWRKRKAWQPGWEYFI